MLKELETKINGKFKAKILKDTDKDYYIVSCNVYGSEIKFSGDSLTINKKLTELAFLLYDVAGEIKIRSIINKSWGSENEKL